MTFRQLAGSGFFFVIAMVAASCGSASGNNTAAPTTQAPVTTIEATTAAPTTQPEPETPAILTSYELASGLIDGTNGNRPSQVQGLLGVPEGPGPFPVAIVMHGSHPACVDDFIPETFSEVIVTETQAFLCGTAFPEYIRSDIGLGHIVTALNASGVAAISIDMTSTYVWWGGEPDELATVEQLASTHFDILRRLNSGDGLGLSIDSLAGRLALDQTSIVGHSRSGGHVISLLESAELPFVPVGAVLIEPEVGLPDAAIPDVPILLVRGECDEDVGPEAGRQFLLDTLSPDRSTPAADLFIPAAGHRMLNTGFNGSTCPERGDRSIIQAQAAQAVSSFIASAGREVALVEGAAVTLEGLQGPASVGVDAEPFVAVDPLLIPFATSRSEVLPALPPGADYSDAILEEF